MHSCHFFDDNILTCLLWWSLTSIFICFDVHMLLNSHVSMIFCSHVYLLWGSHTYLLVCLYAHMVGPFDDYLLLCWNALMIVCSHTLIFPCLISTHMCAHLDDEMSIGFRVKVIVYLHVHSLKCFDDSTWMLRWLGD